MIGDDTVRAPYALPAMPVGRGMETVDQQVVRAPVSAIFALARDVERWPAHLAHYRRVTFVHRAADGGGLVHMSARRPFGPVAWPAWWESEMTVDAGRPAIRYRHVRGVTAGMDVEWTFTPHEEGTLARIVHVWNGPPWPLIGLFAATAVIGPVFVHGIASRTLAGLAGVAERRGAVGRRRDSGGFTGGEGS